MAAAAGSSVVDPVKKKTRAGGGRSQPRGGRSTTGPIERGTEALVLQGGLLQFGADRDEANPEVVGLRRRPIGRGIDVLILQEDLLQSVGGSRGGLLQSVGESRGGLFQAANGSRKVLSTVKDR